MAEGQRFRIRTAREMSYAEHAEMEEIRRGLLDETRPLAERIELLLRGYALFLEGATRDQLAQLPVDQGDALWAAIMQAQNPPRWYLVRPRYVHIAADGTVRVR